ncbi:hypothetical protein EZV62_004506 [Acer yangbiense]|uniref:Disease resistance protein At4g27190-like leucine-rich repeats domain-containing protein n=1 Tax=Acer yangbiense TaxID=1000413 RepID=A0A5C7IK42_9ROSI|nr:hypothetical protein EZV62_004506 [Acer yangbiense]
MRVSDCNGLRRLVTAAVAKSLVQLLHMRIKNCNEMTEIVAIGDVKEDEIIFNNLKELELTDLSNLTSFYSANYTLSFPSLNELHVTRCPKMKFFSSGISSMPMLQQIEWGSSWTMEKLKKFMEKEAEVPISLHLSGSLPKIETASNKDGFCNPQDCPKGFLVGQESDPADRAIVYWYLHGLRMRHTPPSVLSGLIEINGESVVSWHREAAC